VNTHATAAHAIAAASPVAHAEQARASHYEHAPGKSGSADFAQILGRQVAARGPAQGSETESKKVPNVNVTSVTTPEPRGTGLATTDKLGTSTPTAPLCHKQDAPSKEPTEDPTGGHAAALFKDPIVKVAQSATVRTLDAPDVRRSQRELAASIPAATEESTPPDMATTTLGIILRSSPFIPGLEFVLSEPVQTTLPGRPQPARRSYIAGRVAIRCPAECSISL